MKSIVADAKNVGFCGIFCGACKRFLSDGCPGCRENAKASWCKVRTCCLERKFDSCADCDTHDDPKDCTKFHNAFSRIIGFLLRSDRAACIQQIKDLGLEAHAEAMAELGRPSLKA